MIKLIAFNILVCYLFYFCDCGTLPSGQLAEQTLITSLLNGYDSNIRPDDQVSVDITATIQQIVDIDEKQQIMTSSSFISQTWFDDRLSWTPNATNNNIEVVMLPVTSLWIPDTMILNSADTSGYLTINTYSMASVNSNGQVYMILPALTVKTRCSMLLQDFPFDRQMCPINLTSWTQGSNRVLYTENGSLVIDISGYTEHPLWKLTGTDMVVIRSEDRSPYEDTYNDVISIQLYLQRKPLYFIVNGIFACLVLNCVTLLAYALSFLAQISLCMICFLTYSVYSLTFSNLFPQQSDYIMMITLYFLLSIFWTAISMAWFVICNHLITKGEMPKSLHNFCGWLQRVLFCCFPPPKKDEKADKKNDVIVGNSELKKPEDQESTKAKSTQIMKCVSCQKLFASCCGKPIRVASTDEKQHNFDENMQSTKKNPTERSASVIINTKVPLSSVRLEPITTNPTEGKPIETVTTNESINETNEKTKSKCDRCDRCETCQASFDKDQANDKKKKDIEVKCSALNYFIFFCVLLFMFISNMALWLTMSK